MENISEITRLIISNFNKPIDKTEFEERIETELEYIELYKELITGVVNGTTVETRLKDKCLSNTNSADITFPSNIKINNINDIYFIDDITFVYKIIQYRKLEITKQLSIIKYTLELFNYLVVCSLRLTEKKQTNPETQISDDEIDVLNQNKVGVRKILEDLLENNGHNLLIKKLNKYICLEKTLQSFTDKLDKITIQ
jgi:hypothetical protein